MRLLLVCAISAISLAACATPSAEEREARSREYLAKEVDDEVTVGREIAAKLLGRFGRYDGAPEATEYVSLVGRTLARAAGRPELEFRFSVLDAEEVNAFATPGGFVFVTRGLLREARNEAELAGVLGHEIAHVNEKHMYNEIAPKKDMTATETMARFVSMGRGDLGGSVSKIVNAGLKMLLEEGLGKEKEYAADQAGSMYAQAAGYDPRALLGLVRRMGSDKADINLKLPKTHPPFAERIASLDKYLTESGLKSTSAAADAGVMKTRFKKAMGKVQAAGAKPSLQPVEEE